MNHLLLPQSPRLAGSRLAIGWALRLLALLAGVLAMHLWVGPGPATLSVPAYTTASPASAVSPVSSVVPAALTNSLASHLDGPHTGSSAGVGVGADGQVLAAASTATDHGSFDSSSCASICPNSHVMMAAICMAALLAVGAAGLYWLRSSLISRWTLLRGPPVLTALPTFRPRTVSLVQLSISRT